MKKKQHKRTRPRQSNYLRKVQYLARIGALPAGVHTLDAAHDHWCRIYTDGLCNCDPDITIRWSVHAGANN